MAARRGTSLLSEQQKLRERHREREAAAGPCRAAEQPALPALPLPRRTALLERCLRRLEYEKAKEAEARAQADQLEAERAAMQAIDWCARQRGRA